jgi:hypothetical protein
MRRHFASALLVDIFSHVGSTPNWVDVQAFHMIGVTPRPDTREPEGR